MLPIFTTGQVKDGIDTGDLMLDLSDYMKKKDAATKIELNNLSAIVANKLDVEPQHSHHIEDIKQLQSLLDGKYDKGEKYSYNKILSNPEQIAYLEAPTVRTLNINGYTFYVDTNGDLMITLNNVLIGSYSTVSGKWSFETDTSNIENVLENHGEALNAVRNATLKNTTDIANHTHETLDNDLSVNGTIKSNQLCCDTITFDTVNENTGKCSINGTEIWRIQKNSWMYIYQILSLSKSLIVDENATVRKNLNVKESLTLNGWDVETKINEIENILKNHYDALALLCEKHGMIDSNTSDGDKISPQ